MTDKNECERFQTVLDQHPGGMPDGEELEFLTNHAKGCPGCEMLLALHRHLALRVPDDLENEVPDGMVDTMWQRVVGEVIERESRRKHFFASFGNLGRALVPALSVIVVLLAVATGYMYGELTELRRLRRPATALELLAEEPQRISPRAPVTEETGTDEVGLQSEPAADAVVHKARSEKDEAVEVKKTGPKAVVEIERSAREAVSERERSAAIPEHTAALSELTASKNAPVTSSSLMMPQHRPGTGRDYYTVADLIALLRGLDPDTEILSAAETAQLLARYGSWHLMVTRRYTRGVELGDGLQADEATRLIMALPLEPEDRIPQKQLKAFRDGTTPLDEILKKKRKP